MKPIRIYVVSLERSADRRANMRVQLGALGLDYEFFPAVDGMAGEHLRFANYSDKFCLKAWRRPLTPGEVGCFASHYSLWQRCVERDEPMIVMEDDVEVSPCLTEAMQLMPSLAGVGYVRLAGVRTRRFRSIPRDLPPPWKLVRFLTGPMGTQCYVLFPRGAAHFLVSSYRWTLPVDIYMDSFWKHGVSCLGLMPFSVSIPRVLRSTISLGGPTPSALMRHRVWRPKRFLARKLAEFRGHWTNLEYTVGLRNPECPNDVRS
jgi:glycosyl transferase family 25